MNLLYRVSEVKLSYRTKFNSTNKVQVRSSADCYKLLINHWDKGQLEHRESFKLILLNQTNIVLGIHTVSEGGISDTLVDVRLILQAALLANASAIILAHNHPSGNPSPSRQDTAITAKIKAAAELMNIKVDDHLIVCRNNYYSFADAGMF